MAKHHNKALSVLLASMMVASMCCVPTTVSAASTTKEESGSSLAKYYSTNNAGFGKNKTISVDGDLSDWDSSMLIAQGTANDDPRVYRPNSMYEVGVDLYALYGAYDDNNVYLMWEMTNVQDVVAPSDDYPLSQGTLWQTQEFPFFIAVDTGKADTAIGQKGALTTGGTIWNSGMTFENSFNKLISINTKGGNGPWVYGGDSTGLNPVELLDRSTSKIKMDFGQGILSKNVYGIDKAYGEYNGRVPGDVCDDSSAWIDFNTAGHSSSTMDFFYELSIPYSELGITKNDVQENGIGVMLVATMGMSPMDCLPGDPVMTDQADLDDAANSQENNSFEKSDEDHITAPFARIGKSGGTIIPTNPTDPTDPTSTDPTDPTSPTIPSGVTGYKEVTVAEGDTVTFTVDVTTSSKIGSYLMTTKYDASAFEIDTTYSEDGVSTLAVKNGQEIVNTTVAGQVKAAALSPVTSPYAADKGATIQTIQLKAKKAGTFAISYTIDEMIDDNENDLVLNNKPLNGVTVSEKATVNGETPTEPADVVTGSTTASFKAGDTVEYYVNMKFAKELYGFQTDINYDSALLEVESVEYPNFDGTTMENTTVAGKISAIGAGSPTKTFDFTTEKALIKVTFKALADGTDSTISYLMKQTVDPDEKEYFDKTTGQPITSDVSTSSNAKVVGETPTELSTTAATEITVKAGDKVNYWVEVELPADKLDVAGWTVDMYFDKDVFDANMEFAGGNGFAAGTNAINYALGLSNTEVSFPGGSLAQATIVDGRASITDANPNGLNFKGKTTKVVCVQLIAEKDATTTISYRMRDLVDTQLNNSYVNKEDNQPMGGAKYSYDVKIITNQVSTEKTLYLKPNANWLGSNARFAVYVEGADGGEWISMKNAGNGYYKVVVPAKNYTSVKFYRMNPATEENKEANRWNFSTKMTIPTDDTNCFTVGEKEWSGADKTGATGDWSVYAPQIKTLYLKPNANWIKSNARFAMYVKDANGNTEWVSMTDLGDGYYSAEVPEGEYTTVSFGRMKPETTENNAAN
ncbi:MAG: cohesin domain-containing protein, partial [Acutalibacteraceae bacterium]|nr:cohesin domain-containing protein [Acutalibacteraceae bacterium]